MRTVNEIDDNQFRESKIETVKKYDDGFVVAKKDGWSLTIKNSDSEIPIEPKAGDVIRIYGKGIGYLMRGVAINGKIVYYKRKK